MLRPRGGQTAIKVDGEGGVKAAEPKTRWIAPAISVLIATKSLDNDAEHRDGGDANVGGRTRGGASGLGLLGAAAAQASRTVGSALGFYGMAWSVYTNILARGGEFEFGDNTGRGHPVRSTRASGYFQVHRLFRRCTPNLEFGVVLARSVARPRQHNDLSLN